MDILSLLTLPFKLIWAIVSFPINLAVNLLGFLTHFILGVVSFPINLALNLIGIITHGVIGTFMAVVLFFATPFGFFSSEHPITSSSTISASASSPQIAMTTYESSYTAIGNDQAFLQKLNESLPEELLGLYGGIPDSEKIDAAQYTCKALERGLRLTDLNLLGMKIDRSSVSNQKYIAALMQSGIETYCPKTEYKYQVAVIRSYVSNL